MEGIIITIALYIALAFAVFCMILLLIMLIKDILPEKRPRKTKKVKVKQMTKKELQSEIKRIKEHIYIHYDDINFHIYVKKYDKSYIGGYEYQILGVITKEQANDLQYSVNWQKVAYKDLPVDIPYLLVKTLDKELRYNVEYYVLLNGEIEVKDGEVKFNFYKEDKQ